MFRCNKARFMSLLIILLIIVATNAESAGRRLPGNTKLAGLNGGFIRKNDFRGHYTVVQFFASWCKECGNAMANVAGLAGEMHRKGSKVYFVGVSVDEKISEARSFFAGKPDAVKRLVKYSYHDPAGRLASKLGVKGIPTVLVIGPKGRILMSMTDRPTQKDVGRLQQLCRKK